MNTNSSGNALSSQHRILISF